MRTLPKVIITCLLIPILIVPLSAQELIGKGVKTGLYLTSVSGDSVEDASSVIGFGIGGYVTFEINDALSIQPEILYSKKGYEQDFSFFGFGVSSTVVVNYLDLNPLVLYSITDKIYALGGPTLGFFLGGTSTTEVTGFGETEKDEMDIESDDMNGMDFGIIVGGGYKRGAINVEVRYSLGLKNAYDEDFDAKNSAIQIMASYPL